MTNPRYIKVYLKEGDEEIIEKIQEKTFNNASSLFRKALHYYYEHDIKQPRGNKK